MNKVNHITEREKEVLELLVDGFTNKEIGEKLNITFHTVKAHVSSLYEKTGSSCRVSLAVKALKLGLLDTYLEYESK